MDIGIDIQKTRAFKSFHKNKRFYEKIFSKEEIAYCMKKKDYKTCFCGKFCLKEAVIKAFDKKFSLNDIEVLNTDSGKPYVTIKKIKRKNVLTSLSHSDDVCVGVAIKS